MKSVDAKIMELGLDGGSVAVAVLRSIRERGYLEREAFKPFMTRDEILTMLRVGKEAAEKAPDVRGEIAAWESTLAQFMSV